MSKSAQATDTPAHVREKGERGENCPLCGKFSRTEGWLGHHLVKAHPGYLSSLSPAGVREDPTLKYNLAQADYLAMMRRLGPQRGGLAYRNLKRVGAI